MLTQEKLDRINELANEKKIRALTEEELLEQKNLREEYLASFRKRFTAQLENIEIEYID